MQTELKLIECPRDAMQGLHTFIPTETKAKYIQGLLNVGFDTIDFGSFVSEKAIPQLRATREVLAQLDLSTTVSKLLAIVANTRGAETAVTFSEIQYLGFPFSISETFQQRNTNSSIAQSLDRVKEIQELCVKSNKELVVYISMGFGNPYGDEWHPDIAIQWSERLYRELGVKIIALSDTIGVAQPKIITDLFTALIPALPEVEFGAHLHTTPDIWREKIEAAWQAGCKRYDGALKGLGGCPMAADTLTGNMPMENLVQYFSEIGLTDHLNESQLSSSLREALTVFPSH